MGIAWGNPEQRNRVILAYGHTDYSRENQADEDTFYDLASLTKPMATTLAILSLLKDGIIRLSDRIFDNFPSIKYSSPSKISIKDILCHSAGLPAYKPYYTELEKLPVEKRKEALFHLIASEPLVYEPGSTSVYSDIGFMLLGLLIEEKTGMELPFFFREKVAAPLGLEKKIFYWPSGLIGEIEKKKIKIAPTEKCPIRNRVLHGEVSDENASALGGVAGHAGLFGTVGGILEMAVFLLDQWQGREEHPSYQSRDLRQFLTRQNIPGSTWALGFDTPSATSSSGGRYLAPTSVGHLGFTGTSFWIDPTRELVMVLLSNRVHPSRENSGIKQFRPLFHETVMESIGMV